MVEKDETEDEVEKVEDEPKEEPEIEHPSLEEIVPGASIATATIPRLETALMAKQWENVKRLSVVLRSAVKLHFKGTGKDMEEEIIRGYFNKFQGHLDNPSIYGEEAKHRVCENDFDEIMTIMRENGVQIV